MNRILLFIIVIFANIFSGTAQERFLKRAQEAIVKGDLLKAEGYVNSYESKESEQPQSNYLKYHIKLKTSGSTISGLDSAYLFLHKAMKGITGFSQKDLAELCEDIGYCQDKLVSDSLYIDSLIFDAYGRENRFEDLSRFIQKYPASRFIVQAKNIRAHLAFLAAKEKNTELAYENYLRDYEGFPDVKSAKELMWELGYGIAVQQNTIDAFTGFIKKYPLAGQISQAKAKIIDLAWNEAVAENSKKGFEYFISTYPEAPQKQQAAEKILELDWALALNDNTIEGFKKFLILHPNSNKEILANQYIENLSWKQAKSANTLVSINTFIEKYPNSIHIKEAKGIVDFLTSQVFPFITEARKYRLYDAINKSFIDEELYDHMEMLGDKQYLVMKYKKYGVIDAKGVPLAKVTYDCISKFIDGVAIAVLGGKKGLINLNGEQLLPFTFEDITKVDKGLYILSRQSQLGKLKFGLCDGNGKMLIEMFYDDLSFHSKEILIGSKDGLYFALTNAGKPLTPGYQSLRVLDKNMFVVSQKDLYGVVRMDGSPIIPLTYSYINYIDSTGFIVTLKDGRDGILALDGKELLAPLKAKIYSHSKNLFQVDKGIYADSVSQGNNSKIYLFNVKTKQYYNTLPYDEVGLLSEGLIGVKHSSKSGYIDSAGIQKVSINFTLRADNFAYEDMMVEGDGEADYDSDNNGIPFCIPSIENLPTQHYGNLIKIYSEYAEGLAALIIDNKFGYVNKSGGIAIPFIYEYATPFTYGLANVVLKEGDKALPMIINKEGKVVQKGYRLYAFDEDSKTAILSGQTSNSGMEFAIMDMATQKIIKSFKDILDLNKYNNYYIATYKDLKVVITLDGSVLMAPGIDFTRYEAKKMVSEGWNLFYTQKYDEAISKFNEALDLIPNFESALIGLAGVYVKLDNYSYAIRTYDQLLSINPQNLEIHLSKLELNYSKSNWQNVIDDCKKIIELGNVSNDDDIYFKKAHAEKQLYKIDDSIESATKGLAINPDYSWAYNLRGLCYLNKRDFTKALQDFSMAVKKEIGGGNNENLGAYYNNRGVAFNNLQRKAEACADFKRASDLGDSNGISNLRNCK